MQEDNPRINIITPNYNLKGSIGELLASVLNDLWLRFSAHYRSCFIPEYLGYYRVMPDQISSDKSGRFKSNEAIIHDFRTQFPDVLSAAQFNEAFAFFYARKARHLAGAGHYGQALKSIATSLRHRPFYKVPWRSLGAFLLKKRT